MFTAFPGREDGSTDAPHVGTRRNVHLRHHHDHGSRFTCEQTKEDLQIKIQVFYFFLVDFS